LIRNHTRITHICLSSFKFANPFFTINSCVLFDHQTIISTSFFTI
jgi:hypothetical protein